MTPPRSRFRRQWLRWPRRALPALCALLVLAGGPLRAQEQMPVFHGEVSRVRVDVIVKNDDGRFVYDLQPDDFLLYEDDVPQRILSVDLVHGVLDVGVGESGGPSSAEAAELPAHGNVRSTGAAGGTAGASSIAAPDVATDQTIAASSDLGAIVYLIDWRRLEPESMARFTRAWRQRVSGVERLATPQAAFLIDRNGVFRQLAPLTTDTAVLQDAVEELAREPKFGFPADYYLSPAAPSYAPVIRSELAVLDLIEEFCSSLGSVRGRKALVWVSGGFRTGKTPFDILPIMRERLESLAHTANSANLSIYAVDPKRRIAQEHNFYRSAFDVSRRSALGSGGRSIANELFDLSMAEFYDDSLRNGIVYAARDTGGASFLSWSDTDRVLDDIAEDTGSYYLLTYEPPSRIGDGRYHSIRVEARDPSLKLRYRAGYVDFREGDLRERRLAGALAAPGITAGFPLRIEPAGAAAAEGLTLSLIEITGDLPAPGRATEADSDLAFAMSGFAVPRGQDRLIRVRRWLRWRDIEILTDNIATGTRFMVRQGWQLGPGEYEVRVALYRLSTDEIASARMHLCVETTERPGEGVPAYVPRRCPE